MRRIVGILLAAGLLVSGLVAATGAGAAVAEEQHCRVRVLGQQPSGELIMSGIACTEAPAVAGVLASTIAAHFDGLGWTGSYLTVEAASCSGWWNLPSAWNDRISSTLSHCTVRHHRNVNLGGAVEYTFDPGGNLGALNNQTSSVRYL